MIGGVTRQLCILEIKQLGFVRYKSQLCISEIKQLWLFLLIAVKIRVV